MGKKYTKKIRQRPLREDWCEALLVTKGENGETLYRNLQESVRQLQDSVEACKKHLNENPLTPVVAQAAAKELKWGGRAAITINHNGVIVVEIVPGKSGGWVSNIPPIQEMREEAASIGLDISSFGRSRKKIFEALQKAKENPISLKTGRKKMVKTGDAITSPRIIETSDTPSNDLPDDLLEGDEPAPDMQAILQDSDSIDIDSILNDS